MLVLNKILSVLKADFKLICSILIEFCQVFTRMLFMESLNILEEGHKMIIIFLKESALLYKENNYS